jgi:WD repeat-containing protein 23
LLSSHFSFSVFFQVSSHEDDVNTVCFADSNAQLFLTGSDDCLVKMWDRRILNTGEDSNRRQAPIGVFAGHSEGITAVNAKVASSSPRFFFTL